jgi:glycosyltransferase involved in cell wall biosynthesis
VARSASRTAEALARLGNEVHVLSWTKLLAPGQLESAILGAEQSEPRPVTLHRLGLFANWDFSLQHTMNVVEWLHGRHAFDALWGHYLYAAGFMAVMSAELLGIGATVSARGNDVDRIMFPPGDFARLVWTLERARVISAVSRDLARKIDVLLGRSGAATVVHNSVDARVFAPTDADPQLKRALGIAPREAVLGFCGELRHKKGVPFLLDALVQVRRSRPACLLVIGEVRAREQTLLTSFASEHPDCGARVIVTGMVEQPQEIARHLCLCDVFLHPSVWDGLPNAVLEAMACRRLVVASDAGGIPEAVTDRGTGYLIPRAQLHRLGDAVLDVLSLSSEQRLEMGRAARQRVEEHFGAEQEAIVLREIVDRLVSSQ